MVGRRVQPFHWHSPINNSGTTLLCDKGTSLMRLTNATGWQLLLCSVDAGGDHRCRDARPVQQTIARPQSESPARLGSAPLHPRYLRAGRSVMPASRRTAPIAVRGRRRARHPAQRRSRGAAIGSRQLRRQSAWWPKRARYLGTNPTGRRSLWCGAFMDMVLKRTGHAGGGNLASAYARYGTRVSGPQVGAIAVMRAQRRRPCRRLSAASTRTAIRSSCRAITTTRWPKLFIRAAASRPT